MPSRSHPFRGYLYIATATFLWESRQPWAARPHRPPGLVESQPEPVSIHSSSFPIPDHAVATRVAADSARSPRRFLAGHASLRHHPMHCGRNSRRGRVQLLLLPRHQRERMSRSPSSFNTLRRSGCCFIWSLAACRSPHHTPCDVGRACRLRLCTGDRSVGFRWLEARQRSAYSHPSSRLSRSRSTTLADTKFSNAHDRWKVLVWVLTRLSAVLDHLQSALENHRPLFHRAVDLHAHLRADLSSRPVLFLPCRPAISEPTKAIVVSCLEPVFSIIIAAIALKETVGPLQIVGIVVVLAATIIVQLPEKGSQEELAIVEPME